MSPIESWALMGCMALSVFFGVKWLIGAVWGKEPPKVGGTGLVGPPPRRIKRHRNKVGYRD